jgi:phosphatidylserine decarboxylase
MKIPLAREGAREILIGLAVLAAWAGLSGWIGQPILAVPGVLLFGAVLVFFRDPDRATRAEPGLVLSAADGRVTDVQRVANHPLVGGPAVRISVFLSVGDVHVNRSPCAGRVIDATRQGGLYLDARDRDCADKNASNTIRLAPDGPLAGPVIVRQLAGKIARRIVCNVASGDRLEAGQKFGMIKFGSRTDVIVPEQAGLQVVARVGQKVHGGTTVLMKVEGDTHAQAVPQ